MHASIDYFFFEKILCKHYNLCINETSIIFYYVSLTAYR